ncbi:MAG: DUF4301 family protein, partial [Smithella sp.]|nr:DUF4301 family protein [Smithella sp.]
FSPGQKNNLISFYESHIENYKFMKFVPASGAASRMFSVWYVAGERGCFGSKKLDQLFLNNLKKMPFFRLIEQAKEKQKITDSGNIGNLLNYILSSDGLNYGQKPKALIPFHYYKSGDIRTPMEEHICEAAYYIRDTHNHCQIHFTLATGHKNEVAKYLRQVIPRYEKLYGLKYNIKFSLQSSSTNTIAVDIHNMPLRDETDKMIFRPGGHGSLLKNLNDLDADFIFIRNIDNIAPESAWSKIIPYRKMIGGFAIQAQEEIFAAIRQLKSTKIKASNIQDIISFCAKKLNVVIPRNMARESLELKRKYLLSQLNRPLRICAMVRNEGEPGGGPFWVLDNDGTISLQIVERGHVNEQDKEQRKIWSQSKYFNPVDMVCGLRNYQGRKFNLFNYVNNNAYLIVQKSEKGRTARALEVPGLWNGSMAYWNTIFVNLPLMVFSPVKTVNDLLRPGHFIT